MKTKARPTRAYRAGILDAYGYRYKLDALVETGLDNGEGSGMLAGFATYIGIEWNERFVNRARKAGFDARYGNSAVVLPQVLQELAAPALFFLDAHGLDCNTEHPTGSFPGWERLPLLDELRAIATWEHAARSVVLIDDMPVIGEWVDLGLDGEGTFESFLDELPVRWRRELVNGMLALTPR